MDIIIGQGHISIHVPREGDDISIFKDGRIQKVFQSTSPVRGTTPHIEQAGRNRAISIHVPREGDDITRHWPVEAAVIFQSTSPVRGTTR